MQVPSATGSLSPPVRAWRAYRAGFVAHAILVGLLVLAAVLRVVFFNGTFGSDDTVYLSRSVEIARGEWSSANYNGALRYGFNLPAGLFIRLFGVNEFAAIVWPLLCSIGEIGLVYAIAQKVWDRRAAVLAAVVLTALPLHVASATRIHADAVVSFFVTLSFVLFFLAESKGSRGLYLCSGLAMGAVFWAKELAALLLLSFAIYPLVFRKLDRR